MRIEESPSKDHVEYSKGYKYQLRRDMQLATPIIGYEVETDWIKLYLDGTLIVKRGYASDGPSGPSIDTKSFMRGAFGHDALYQLIREGLLPASARKLADHFLHDQCLADGMFGWRAMYVEEAVSRFGAKNVLPSSGKEVIIAP